MSPARLSAAGDSGVLLRLGDEISEAMLEKVLAALAALDAHRGRGVTDVVPGYASVMVVFDPEILTPREVRQSIALALASPAPPSASRQPRRVELPVLYQPDPDVGPDLEWLARDKGIALGDVVSRHAAPVYRCHLLGFRPGFPFLGGLDPGLTTPRLSTPRPRVPAGSVGIAGRQTGVYPVSGPGGWRIIGRTPLVLFDPGRASPFLVGPGDEVKFVAIDRPEFQRLAGSAIAGVTWGST